MIPNKFYNGIFNFSRRSMASQARRVVVAENSPSRPRTLMLSCQSREMNHIEQAPVMKKRNTMSDEAEPTTVHRTIKIRGR